MSVTAVSGAKVEELHALNLQDWSGYVPGFSVGSLGAPGEALLTVDGIGPLGAASEVGVYLNDTPVGSSSSFQDGNAFTADLMPYDLTRIEVLRGPQGTLYGASTMGGLVKYVLAQPDPSHFSARIGGDLFGISHAGDVGGGVRGEANLPIVNDQLALRVSGYDEDTPGYIDNATTGQKDDNALRQYGGRVALLWRPTSDVSLQASALYQNNHSDNQNYVALDTVDAAADRRPADQHQHPGRAVHPDPAALRPDAELEPALGPADVGLQLPEVRQHDAGRPDRLHRRLPRLLRRAGPRPVGPAGEVRAQQVHPGSAAGLAERPEARVAGGAFYTHEDASNHEQINAYDANGALLPGINPLELVTLPSTYQEYAFFGDVTYHFTELVRSHRRPALRPQRPDVRRAGGRRPAEPGRSGDAGADRARPLERGRHHLPGRA